MGFRATAHYPLSAWATAHYPMSFRATAQNPMSSRATAHVSTRLLISLDLFLIRIYYYYNIVLYIETVHISFSISYYILHYAIFNYILEINQKPKERSGGGAHSNAATRPRNSPLFLKLENGPTNQRKGREANSNEASRPSNFLPFPILPLTRERRQLDKEAHGLWPWGE